MENLTERVLDIITNNILAPALLAIGSAILLIIRSYAEKMMKSIVSKNEKECLELETKTKVNILAEIDNIVSGAVAANMKLAEELKIAAAEKGRDLTSAEVAMLNNSARELIMNALPDSLTREGGILHTIVGGSEKLRIIIDDSIEKHVIDHRGDMYGYRQYPQKNINGNGH